MAEIVEKSLMIALSISIILTLFSIVMPLLNLIIQTTYQMQIQEVTYNVESGINDAVENPSNDFSRNGYSAVKIDIEAVNLGEVCSLYFTFRNYTISISVNTEVRINSSSIFGNYYLNFYYDNQLSLLEMNITNIAER